MASKDAPQKPRDKSKALTKTQLYQELAEATGLSKIQIGEVLDALNNLIQAELNSDGPGSLTLPGMLKLRRVEKPATKERKGRNPSTGEEMMIPAKPKSTAVRARVLKNLKDSVQQSTAAEN